MPSTFVHTLLPASCVASTRFALPKLSQREWLKLIFASIVIANAPDLDIIPATLMPSSWESIHRNWGHNLFSLVGWTLLGSWVLGSWVTSKFSRRRSILLAACLVASHVILDACGGADGLGNLPTVPLFWPLSNFKLHLVAFFPTPIVDKATHPLWAHITSVQFWQGYFFKEMAASVALWMGWSVLAQVAKRLMPKPAAKNSTRAIKATAKATGKTKSRAKTRTKRAA